jgi:hypothetical protein
MTAKRSRLQRLPRLQTLPEVLIAFRKIKELESQCTCSPIASEDECPACKAWWKQHEIIRRALQIPPHVWPVLPMPARRGARVGATALALYAELEAALAA